MGLRYRRKFAVRRCSVWFASGTLLLTGCGGNGDVESAEGDPETIVEEAQEQDFEELVVDEPFEGTAVVTEVISPRAFKLFDTLVVARHDLDLRADERARVRGTVRSTTIEALERELAVDLADAVGEAHDGGLLIVADEVTPVDFPEPID